MPEVSGVEKEYYVIYALIYEEGEEERVKEVDVLELVQTDLSLNWVIEYAKENYGDDYAEVGVKKIEDVSIISAPTDVSVSEIIERG